MILSEMNIPVKTVNALGKKKINTVNDLVMYFPRKYLDYRKIVPLMEAVDRDCAISGYLESYEKQTDKNMTIIKAHLIEESSGQKVTITWIGQSYQYNAIKNFARKEIVVCGKVKHHIVYGYTVTNPYVVCPLINKADEESVTGDLESVEEAEIRYKEYFMPKGYKVGVITGQTSAEDTEMILNDFRENRYQILVSTTVIEVGVNVPNANVMVINNAERFGLAQLHQLRGRVCRGQWYPYCILKSREKENPRLQTMVQTTNGFEIAKADIEQRGMGDLLGVAQSGSSHYMDQILAMPNLYGSVKKYAQLLIDNHMEDPLIELYEK